MSAIDPGAVKGSTRLAVARSVEQDNQAAMFIGAESLSGGTTTTSIFEVVLSTRPQFGQWNKWLIMSRASKVDRVHFMSM